MYKESVKRTKLWRIRTKTRVTLVTNQRNKWLPKSKGTPNDSKSLLGRSNSFWIGVKLVGVRQTAIGLEAQPTFAKIKAFLLGKEAPKFCQQIFWTKMPQPERA
jgi:hypothetical protein